MTYRADSAPHGAASIAGAIIPPDPEPAPYGAVAGSDSASPPTIIDAIHDPALFEPWFAGPTWTAWEVFLKALFGLPMTAADLGVFHEITGREVAPTEQATEAWLICGRRGGKSFITALIATYLATFRDYSAHLVPGERGLVMCLAADRKQARVIFRYVLGLIEGVSMLRALIENVTAETIDLTNGISIEIHTASFRSVRGFTICAALCDETAFWRSEESANPDREILDALRPAMATITGALLIALGTPYRRSGVMHDAWRDHFGRDGDPTLVIKGDTRTFNPTIPESVIDAAYERGPVSAAAEFGAEFRSDISSFVSRAAAEACVVEDRFELPPVSGTKYAAFVDPSGGARDSMTLAIGHLAGDCRVLDAIREAKPPFSPDGVVQEFADLCKAYWVGSVTGDRYAGEWPRERFRAAGIAYLLSPKTKSDLYRDILPLINSGQIELLDVPLILAQLLALERRTARSGKDSIDHPPRSHDDIINSVAGVLDVLSAPLLVRRTLRVRA